MMRKILTLLAAVFAIGLVVGSATEASARGAYRGYGSTAGCCGPLKPTYIYHRVHKDIYVNRHVHKSYTTRFPRFHPIYHVTVMDRTIHYNTITHLIHHRVGYVVDVPSFKTVSVTHTTHSYHVIRTADCRCGPVSSRCR